MRTRRSEQLLRNRSSAHCSWCSDASRVRSRGTQTMVADRRRRPARAGTTAATIPSRYARCQCSAATATHDAQKLDELAPRLGRNHDAQDESRQADRQCTSRSVAFRKVHSRVRHFGGVLVEMVESWLPTTVSDMREKQNRLSACCLHETGMRLS